MNTENDKLLETLREVARNLNDAIMLRRKEIEAARNLGFNPDDTTRKEED